MPTPRLILWYARSEGDGFLDRFFQDLRKEIALREGLNNDDDNPEPGFRDTDSMPGGSNWREELAKALAESWTCVCIYTPNYFSRESCGKEFQVFLDRSHVQYDPDGSVTGAKGIFPVLWVSMDDLKRKKLPPRIAEGINFRARKHQDRYEKEGLRHILRRSPKTVYVDILDDIVRDLIQLFNRRPDPLPALPRYEKVKNAFWQQPAAGRDEPPAGPRNVQVFLIEAPDATQPSLVQEGEDSWQEILQTSHPDFQLRIEALHPARQVPAALTERVVELNRRNVVTLIMVAPSAASNQAAATQALIDSLSASGDWLGGIIVPAPGAAPVLKANIPPTSLDRIFVRTTNNDTAAIVDSVRDLTIEVIGRIVTDAEVRQHAPGGAKPSAKPKIQGPVKENGS